MAHERSETVEREGRWYNVYGQGLPKAGQPLPMLFPWESESYKSEAEAVGAAKRRSEGIDPKTERPYADPDVAESRLRQYDERREQLLELLPGLRLKEAEAGEAVTEAQKAQQRVTEERVRPAVERVRRAAEVPAPPLPTTLPEPARPRQTVQPFLEPRTARGALDAIVSGLGLIAQMAAASGAPAAGLAALTGAMRGWQEGDREAAERSWRDYLGAVDSIRNENAQALRLWKAAMEASGGNLERQKAMLTAELASAGREDLAVEVAERGVEHAGRRLDRLHQEVDRVDAHSDRLIQQMWLKAFREDAGRRAEEMLKLREREVKVKEQEAAGETDEQNLDVGARRLMRGDPPTAIVRGIGKRASKRFEQIQNRAAELWREEGLSDEEIATRLSRARMSMGANTAALSRITTQEAQLAPFTETARDSLRRARELSAKIDRTGVPVINRWLLAGRKAVRGDPDVATFDYHLRLGINEVAKITSSATGGGGVVSDTARKEIEDTINRAMTHGQISRVIEGAEYEMSSRLRHIARQKEALLGGGAAIGGPATDRVRVRRKADGARGTIERKDLSDIYEVIESGR